MPKSITRDTRLRPGALYRITAICPSDHTPTMKVGDVVTCATERARCVSPEPDDGWWFADYLGHESGYGTLVIGIEEVPGNGAA